MSVSSAGRQVVLPDSRSDLISNSLVILSQHRDSRSDFILNVVIKRGNENYSYVMIPPRDS